MRKKILRGALLLALGSLFFLPATKGQEMKMKPEGYSGTAIGTGGSVGGRSIGFNIRITRYTTDNELQEFADLIKEKGPDALRRALEKEEHPLLLDEGADHADDHGDRRVG